MGQSPTASIIFGYVFTEENVWPWQAEEDFLEEGEEADIKRDWSEREWYCHIALNKTVQQVENMSWEEKKAIWDDIPIEVDVWGYMEDPCYMIYPTGAIIHASWDSPETIDITWFHDDKNLCKWIQQLVQFSKDMKIDLKDKRPSFQLVASYG